jgi:pimeloyl-ACP methyl ester carboxylesterase
MGSSQMKSAPHEASRETVTVRQGQLWINGDLIPTEAGTVERGQMFVAWQAPANVTQPYPLILVHGGGGQGTDWLGTPDGRPGWADRLVQAGFAVYVVDRPGHGRSPYHPDVLGPSGSPASLEMARWLFASPEAADRQAQWPWARDLGGAELRQLAAAMGPVLADAAEGQRLDGERLAGLLDLTGPAVLVTHSAGAPAGWLAANKRPGVVQAIVAVEPIGPPFADIPGFGRLDWGLTAARADFIPPAASVAELGAEAGALPSGRVMTGLAAVPVCVVAGDISAPAEFAPRVAAFLDAVGARAQLLRLADHGLTGNGHGLIFEANSDQTVGPVIDWVRGVTG